MGNQPPKSLGTFADVGVNVTDYKPTAGDKYNDKGEVVITPTKEEIYRIFTEHGGQTYDPSGMNSIIPKPLNYFAHSYTSLISILSQTLAFQAITGEGLKSVLIGGSQFGTKTMCDLIAEDLGGEGAFTVAFRVSPTEITCALNLAEFLLIAKDNSWITKLLGISAGFAGAEVWAMLMEIFNVLFGWISEDSKNFWLNAMKLGGGRQDASLGLAVPKPGSSTDATTKPSSGSSASGSSASSTSKK
jgi:hypothetical protein